MRVLCLHLEHFAVAVEISACPELGGRPVVVGGLPHQRKPVLDCSPEAACLGVKAGMPLRQAHHLCPDAVFIPPDEEKYARAFEDVLLVLDRFSPAVESDTPGKAFLDASGLEKGYPSEKALATRVLHEVSARTGLSPAIGIASGKFTAGVAATLCPGGGFTIVAAGTERHFLAAVSTGLLPVAEDMKYRLKLLGLGTLGQLAALPRDALVDQFGREGLLAHRLASGMDDRPVVPRPVPGILRGETCFDSPMEGIEGLMAALENLLDRLLPELQARGQACGRVLLRLDLDSADPWQQSLSLKSPTGSKRELRDRIRRRLERLRFPARVSGVALALADLGGEPASQGSLLRSAHGGQDSEIGRLARQLRSRLGHPSLKRIVALDPGSRIPERRAGLIDFPEA